MSLRWVQRRGSYFLIGVVVFLALDAVLSLGLVTWLTVKEKRFTIRGHHLMVLEDGLLSLEGRGVIASFTTPPRAYLISPRPGEGAGLRNGPGPVVCIEGRLGVRTTVGTCLVHAQETPRGGHEAAWLIAFLAPRWGELEADGGIVRRRVGEETIEAHRFLLRAERSEPTYLEVTTAQESHNFFRVLWVASKDRGANLEDIGKRPFWLWWRAAGWMVEKLFG